MVVILADDCSWYDIGCYGAVNNRTPHIDSLARAGMRFTNAWNSVSTSVPTRHCLYTGMYPIRNGGHYNLSAIREGVETMPVRLARLGYRVGLAGKWHIHPKEAFPFERVPGFAVNCLTKDPSHTMEGVEEFISRDREEPFCLVVASVNPHVPWTGGDPSKFDLGKLVLPPHFVDTPQTRKSYAAYLAEIDLLDREVGDVVRVLRERELLDDTLVIFLSEQGTQLTGAKWTNWNAGVHAAMIARWDGASARAARPTPSCSTKTSCRRSWRWQAEVPTARWTAAASRRSSKGAATATANTPSTSTTTTRRALPIPSAQRATAATG